MIHLLEFLAILWLIALFGGTSIAKLIAGLLLLAMVLNQPDIVTGILDKLKLKGA